MPKRVVQDFGRPMHPIKAVVCCFQQYIPQFARIEYATVQYNRKNRRFQPKAHAVLSSIS